MRRAISTDGETVAFFSGIAVLDGGRILGTFAWDRERCREVWRR
jgi:hypothetical protein